MDSRLLDCTNGNRRREEEKVTVNLSAGGKRLCQPCPMLWIWFPGTGVKLWSNEILSMRFGIRAPAVPVEKTLTMHSLNWIYLHHGSCVIGIDTAILFLHVWSLPFVTFGCRFGRRLSVSSVSDVDQSRVFPTFPGEGRFGQQPRHWAVQPLRALVLIWQPWRSQPANESHFPNSMSEVG